MNQTRNPKFFVHVQVKPYVRRFLELNYGTPVLIAKDPAAHRFLQELLRKPDTNRDKQYPEQICTYTDLAEIVISEHDFYRYGWELTKTDTVAFGRYFEDRAKTLMRNIVGVKVSAGLPLKTAIVNFQERYGFDEDTWSYETIKKDFNRNGFLERIDFETEIFQKIERIVLRNLYGLGTISKSMITTYESDQ